MNHRHSSALCAAGIVALSVALVPGVVRPAAPGDPRWAAVRRVFGQPGEAEGATFKIELPRTDLDVRIGADRLEPRFEFTSYLGFVPMGAGRALAMGEIVLRDVEVAPVLEEAHRENVSISAVHNHLLGEMPRIVYVHVMAEGAPEELARRLRAVYARSATPLGAPREEKPAADWSSIDAILGPHAEAAGRVAEYEFPRRERLTVHGLTVPSNGQLETASEAVFQELPGGRVAGTGELFVLPGEIDPVTRALDEHGLHVTAVHNHMLDETPTMYWIHWYATGRGPELARGVAAALARMNSQRRSEAERH